MTSIIRPGGTTVYIKQETGTTFWSSDTVNWNIISSFPITITNVDTDAGILTVEFTTDLTITTSTGSITCGSRNIQIGKSTLNSDGSRPTITISNVSNYTGFVQNGSGSSGYDNVSIYNLIIDSSGTSSIGFDGGWLTKPNFARGAINNYIENCTSIGDISSGGGICGGFTASSGGVLIVKSCNSKGIIGGTSGGIIGYNSAGSAGSSITVQNCSSTGSIGSIGGGIFGNSCGINGGTVVAENCYSTGLIGAGAGGIFGASAGFGNTGSPGSATATNCYSSGLINGGGGIYGANPGTGSAGSAIASNCYTTGDIVNGGGGIYGSGYTTVPAYNCYTTGSMPIPRGANGGIWQNSASNTLQGANNRSEANAGSSGWNDTNARLILTGAPSSGAIGATWIQLTGPNTPYILAVSGYSPYTAALGNTTSSSITAGGTTQPAVIPGYTFSILSVGALSATSYPTTTLGTFSIDPSTGAITAGASTPGDTYTLVIYSFINPYSITTYTVSVSAIPVESTTPEGVSCCARPIDIGTDVDYETRNKFATGNTMIGGVQGRQPYASYTMLLYKKMAFAAKR